MTCWRSEWDSNCRYNSENIYLTCRPNFRSSAAKWPTEKNPQKGARNWFAPQSHDPVRCIETPLWHIRRRRRSIPTHKSSSMRLHRCPLCLDSDEIPHRSENGAICQYATFASRSERLCASCRCSADVRLGRAAWSGWKAVANLVDQEIAQPLAAVAKGSQQPLIHEISQQDRIAG